MAEINQDKINRLLKIAQKLNDNIYEEEVSVKDRCEKAVEDIKIQHAKFFSSILEVKDIIIQGIDITASHIPALVKKVTTNGNVFFIFDFYRDKVDIACDMGSGFKTVNIICSIRNTPENPVINFDAGLKDNVDPMMKYNIITSNLAILSLGIVAEDTERLIDVIASSIETAITMSEKAAEEAAKKKLDNIIQFPTRK
jgi:hypothetical protein